MGFRFNEVYQKLLTLFATSIPVKVRSHLSTENVHGIMGNATFRFSDSR